MMLYRDELYNENSPAKGIAEVNVTKNRHGPLGTVYRQFRYGHFLPIDQIEAERLSKTAARTERAALRQGKSIVKLTREDEHTITQYIRAARGGYTGPVVIWMERLVELHMPYSELAAKAHTAKAWHESKEGSTMKLESALKHFSAQGLTITDAPNGTSADRVTGTDVMAALGMVEAKARFGMAAFLGKTGISSEDRERAIVELTQYAMKKAPKHVGKVAGRRMAPLYADFGIVGL
ncbi:Replicative DNA helicase [Serratia odorifera]|uniref:Replicative DNA helicase n=1 Tax=Serratia odorifera TaxID=618 RepID=A0A447KR02_SEROD|nr:Replicative DNA helicase [Serratia odorifera]